MRAKVSILWLICLLIPLFASGDVRFYQSLFTDPTEKVCLIMKDKGIFRFTSYNEQRVYISVEGVEKKLKSFGFKISDIEVIIHNHFYNSKFSESDKKLYRTFKRHGFKGKFLMYCHRSEKTYDIDD